MTTPEQAKTKIDDAIAVMNASRACLDALKGLTPDQCRQVLQFLSTLGLGSSVTRSLPQYPAQPEPDQSKWPNQSKWPYHPDIVAVYGAPGLDSSYIHTAVDSSDLEVQPTGDGIFDNGGIFGGEK